MNGSLRGEEQPVNECSKIVVVLGLWVFLVCLVYFVCPVYLVY